MIHGKVGMISHPERRNSTRMVKSYQIYCKSGDLSSIGETCDISDKGVGVLCDLDVQRGDSMEVRIVPTDETFSFTCEGTVRHIGNANGGSGHKYRVGVEFLEGLKDFAAEKLIGGHENISARKSLVINAPPGDCYDAICNFESYPSWQKMVKEVNVLERGKDKRPVLVEFWFDAILKKVRVVNKYEYFDKDFTLSWKATEGDIKTNDGSYVFQKLRQNRTNAVFSVLIELGFYAPKRLLDYMNNISMRNSIRALKDVAESGKLKQK